MGPDAAGRSLALGHWDAALLLLDRGAELNVRNNQGTTLSMALENQRVLVERLQAPLRLERRHAKETH